MSKRLTTEEFIARSLASHDIVYDYSLVEYAGRLQKVKITCTKHSTAFEQQAGLHMDGQTSCHLCVLEKKMESRVTNRRAEVPEGHKRCSRCDGVLSYENFTKNAPGADGYYALCKPCVAVRYKRRLLDPEFVAMNKRNGAAYAKRQKDILNARSARRRAKRIQATVSWANTEFEQLFIEECYNLAKLRSEVTGINWEVDHVVPLNSDVVSGLHCAANLAVIPEHTNRAKSNKYWPDMWEPIKE